MFWAYDFEVMLLRIAFIDQDLSARTGSRRFIYEVARQLEGLGHEVKIVTAGLNRQQCFEEVLSLHTEVVGEKDSFKKVLKRFSTASKKNRVIDWYNMFYYNLRHANLAMRMSKQVEEAECDAAIYQYHGEHWLLPYFYCFKKPKGVVYLNVLPPMPPPLSLPFQEPSTERRLVDKFLNIPPVGTWRKKSFKKLGMIVAPSAYLLEEAKSRDVIGKKKSSIVPLGVNHEEFYPTGEEEPFALYAGRIHPHKSLELAVLAMGKIKSGNSLVIAGDIDEANLWYKVKLEALAEKTKISDRVKIILKPKDSEMVRLMQKCSIFLFPSTIDTFGLVVLEAMACGKPVVACNRGGVPEIAGQSGLLLEPDVTQWQRTVEKLLSDSKFRHRKGSEALERSKEFSWELATDNLLQALGEL